MAQLASWDAGAALGDNTRDRIIASSALPWSPFPATPRVTTCGAASAVEQLWIRAGQHQLGVQPVSPVFLYASSRADLTGLSAEFSGDLQALQRRFESAVGLRIRATSRCWSCG